MAFDSIGEVTNGLLDRWGRDATKLLQILIGLQQRLNHIPDEAIDLLADELAISRAQIETVTGFYSFLHTEPRGQFDILFSDNIIEQMQGSRRFAQRLAQRLECSVGATRADGRVTIGYTSCIGMSDQGPALLVNGRTIPRLDNERIDRVAWLVKSGKAVDSWPEDLFEVSDNIRRRDILLEGDLADGAAIDVALHQDADVVLAQLESSGLRGRGGAGFKTAMKWRFCRQAPTAEPNQRVVVCNADEGEPGTFKDRVLLHSYADRLFEGMTYCAAVIGANQGFLYLRGEYRYLLDGLEAELARRREAGLLGRNIRGKEGFDFDIEIHLGAGAYVCGEESALIESLEGKVGNPRDRPPFPVTFGYLGRPTAVNNVETFVAAAMIAVRGADWFRSRGTDQSAGTKLISVSGDCARPGIYEYPFGVTIRQILFDCGATDTQAVQVGGAAGRTAPVSESGRQLMFEDLATGGSFMIFDNSRKLLEMVKNFTDFFVHESCGFCTPCRVGTTLMQKTLDKVFTGHATGVDLATLTGIGNVMRKTSRCGLGTTAANPILDTLEKFHHIYDERLLHIAFEPGFDLDAALEEARQATGRDDPGAHLHGGGV